MEIIKKNKLNIMWIMIYFSAIIALFNTDEMMPFLRFWDEFIICTLVVLATIKIFLGKYKFSKDDFYSMFLLFFIFLFGVIGSLIFNYQSLMVVVKDILRFARLMLAYFGVKIVFHEYDISGDTSKKFVQISTITFIGIIFVIYCYNMLFPVFPHMFSHQYNMYFSELFFEHVRFMDTALICSGLLLLATNEKHSVKDYITMLLVTLLVIAVLRVTQIAIVFIMWGFLITTSDFKRKIPVWAYAFAIVICVIFFLLRSYNDIDFINSARGKLYYYAIEIAKDHFPIGSGFGTFGTDASWHNYSPLYQQYGLEQTCGFIKGEANFVSDTSWAQIISQTGIIGFLCSFALIIIYYLKTVVESETERVQKSVLRLVWLYIIISSFSASVLMGTESLICGFSFAIIENSINNQESY